MFMALFNLGNVHLSASEMQALDSLITQVEAIILPKSVGLTPQQRQELGSINEKNKLFVNKVADFMENHPQHNTQDIDIIQFKEDLNSREFLETRISRLQNLVDMMTNSKILHDHDNYQDALGYYDYLQFRSKRGIAGVSQLVAELKQFFPRTSTGNTNTNDSSSSLDDGF
jgi:hypothetical protein